METQTAVTPVKWVRHRFHANGDDYRPIAAPPPGPYWCTGSGLTFNVVVAYLPQGEPVTNWWPEATDIDSEPREVILFTDRFARPEWWKPGPDGTMRDASLLYSILSPTAISKLNSITDDSVKQIVCTLTDISDEQRLQVLSFVCKGCGTMNLPCYCQRDD